MATLPYLDTVIAPTGGVNPYAGQGMDYQFTLSLLGESGGQVTIVLTDVLTGLQTQIGAGNVTGTSPTFIYTFGNKVYALAESTAYFSALGQPSVWDDPNAAGNGFITMTNYFATPENLMAIAPYQGNLLFVFRRLVQVWHTDPDPALYALIQTLPNIGTVAPLSVQPIGDMDVYMLADNGFRSVRVRDASNNAIIADVGTPVDAIVIPLLLALTDAQKLGVCGIVEPSSNRYWCYIPLPDGSVGQTFVFSYFPSGQIAAWSTYETTYQVAVGAPAANYVFSTVQYIGLTIGARYAWLPGANEVRIQAGSVSLTKEGAFIATTTTATVVGTGAIVPYTGSLSITTPFVPEKFVVFNGQVWGRSGQQAFQYGGSNNQGYDNSGCNFTMPFDDSGSPGTRKQFSGMDTGYQGSWSVFASGDYTIPVSNWRNIYNNTASSYLLQSIPYVADSTHFAFAATESSSGYALFASILMHISEQNEK